MKVVQQSVPDDLRLYGQIRSGFSREEIDGIKTDLAEKANQKTNVFNKKTFGTYEDASVLSAIANEDNPRPQVLGLVSSQQASSYPNRDTVALYVSNKATKPTVVVNTGTVTYSPLSVQVTGATVANFDKILPGMLIDTYHTPNRYTSIIASVDVTTQTIYVKDGWYLVQSGGSISPATPTNGVGFDINRVTKIWGINNNVFLRVDDTATAGVAEEVGLFNDKTLDGSISFGGIDMVNFKKAVQFGFQTRKDAAAERYLAGFLALDSSNGFEARASDNGFIAIDATNGFNHKTTSTSTKAFVSTLNGDSTDTGFNIDPRGMLSKFKLKLKVYTNGQLTHSDINGRTYIFNKTVRENFTMLEATGRSGEMMFIHNLGSAIVDLKVSTGNFVFNGNSLATLSLMPKSSAILLSDNTSWYALTGHYEKNIPTGVLTGTSAPTTIPDYIGQEYLDTTNKKMYKAFATNASTDWAILN